ncbi:D(2) dopamine receptor [Pteropus vampyrus]|uniref:D(2) dopamine receptor n=1 Tax=Pteropus vampyrus TaxID=132908 RepID=A0A6P3QIH8_PTEVA|nr:D(2) dopamine receptor [Pteropus vampyrus]
MDPLNLSWYDDDLESQNWSRPFNGSEGKADRPHYNYYAMLLTLLIFIIVFGNVLVCMAVSREKALQTTTNYLIVSLAVADLLVATLVMPWVVYLEVVGEWKFSRIHCDIFVTLDVMMCTASILNLCAISIDRYTAVAMPMLYNTRYSSKRRVTVMIAIVWVLSFTISCPLLFGLNHTEQSECIIANPAFVVYSSVVSFYVPFIVTLLVYIKIYIVLRRRRKRVNTKRSSRAFRANLKAPLKGSCTHPEDMKLCTVIMKSNGSFPVNRRRVVSVQARDTEPGVFIICWLPFFITHILNIHCDCNIPPVLYSAFTWLGYVNSAVNPIIYTTFNIEFRKAFMKILHC